MPFKKGKQKTGGRMAGTSNNVTKEVRELLQAVVESNFDQFKKDMAALTSLERARLYLKICGMVMPKQHEISGNLQTDVPVNYVLPDGTLIEF